MMTETDKDFEALEPLFAQARQQAGQMPDGLSLRILADAGTIQAGFSERAPLPENKPGLWSQMLAVLGGWPTMGGLAMACAAGVWIGVAPPAFLPDPARLVIGDEMSIDLLGMGELDAELAEEG